jgi:SHS2 domain-containing protein
MEGDGPATSPSASGHRAVPHTADLRIEAWGPTREQCLGEAALGMVESFADLAGVRASAVRQVRLAEASDDELLAALLEEVVFRLDAR